MSACKACGGEGFVMTALEDGAYSAKTCDACAKGRALDLRCVVQQPRDMRDAQRPRCGGCGNFLDEGHAMECAELNVWPYTKIREMRRAIGKALAIRCDHLAGGQVRTPHRPLCALCVGQIHDVLEKALQEVK